MNDRNANYEQFTNFADEDQSATQSATQVKHYEKQWNIDMYLPCKIGS